MGAKARVGRPVELAPIHAALREDTAPRSIESGVSVGRLLPPRPANTSVGPRKLPLALSLCRSTRPLPIGVGRR